MRFQVLWVGSVGDSWVERHEEWPDTVLDVQMALRSRDEGARAEERAERWQRAREGEGGG